MLEAHNLHKSFGSLVATDDVSITFGEEQGEITFIVGPNGAGKTTFVNLLTGLLEPDSGKVVMDGDDITGLEPHERVHEGLVRSFQVVHIFEDMTTRENLRTAVLSRERMTSSMFSLDDEHEEVERDVDDLLKQFELEDIEHTVAEELPHGDRKLLDVAMSFGLEPSHLLLDEPTSGVSSSEKEQVVETIVEASKAEDVTTVTIEHDMEIVTGYGDRIVALHEGGVLADGDPSLLETDQDLRRVLLGVREE